MFSGKSSQKGGNHKGVDFFFWSLMEGTKCQDILVLPGKQPLMSKFPSTLSLEPAIQLPQKVVLSYVFQVAFCVLISLISNTPVI